jgi:hypothetical protein
MAQPLESRARTLWATALPLPHRTLTLKARMPRTARQPTRFDTEITLRFSLGLSIKPRELGGHPMWTIPSQAPEGEGVTTIPKGSTLKRVEARGTRKGEDIVSSAWQHAAVERRARRSAPCRRSCFKKTFIISGTQEKVAKAGRRSEIARQAVKQMRKVCALAA